MQHNQTNLFPQPPPSNEELSQWFTPRPLAKKIVEYFEVSKGELVLEPSAGDGAFVEACIDRGAEVEAYDIDQRMVEHVRKNYPGCSGGRRDFGDRRVVRDLMEEREQPFDWVILNPPYENDQDMLHLLHAIEIADDHEAELIALIKTSALQGKERYQKLWRFHQPAEIILLPSRPSFYLGGDPTKSPRSDFCVCHFDDHWSEYHEPLVTWKDW